MLKLTGAKKLANRGGPSSVWTSSSRGERLGAPFINPPSLKRRGAQVAQWRPCGNILSPFFGSSKNVLWEFYYESSERKKFSLAARGTLVESSVTARGMFFGSSRARKPPEPPPHHQRRGVERGPLHRNIRKEKKMTLLKHHKSTFQTILRLLRTFRAQRRAQHLDKATPTRRPKTRDAAAA